MTKEELYMKMDIEEEDILKGESLFNSLSTELKKKFLSDIYAEYQPEGFFKSIYYIYGEFPKYRKVVLLNFVFNGSNEEKRRLANGISNPYDNEKIEDLFHLTYDWLKITEDPKIKESLSRGLLFYLDKEEVKEYLKTNIDYNLELIKGIFSWLYIQPNWFREKFKEQEIEIWNKIKDKWSIILNDEFKIREINKSLGLDINRAEIWLHEIENPWSYSDKEIKRLNREGINIKIDGYISEFAMGSPVITGLILNSRCINKSIGGPFITDGENKFLCCTTFVREEGFTLVIIDLKTNEIIELHTGKSVYTPYKYENDEFCIITGYNKINLQKDIIRFNLKEIKRLTTIAPMKSNNPLL